MHDVLGDSDVKPMRSARRAGGMSDPKDVDDVVDDLKVLK
jgi:hypothetical protein